MMGMYIMIIMLYIVIIMLCHYHHILTFILKMYKFPHHNN